MSIEFACPACNKPYRLKDELAGKTARCSCGQQIKIPARAPEPATDLGDLLDEIEEPTKKAPLTPTTPTGQIPDLQKTAWVATGNRPLAPISKWLENTGSALLKILIGAVVGGFFGLKVLARDKGAPAMDLTLRIFMVIGAAVAGAGAASLLIVADVVRNRVNARRRVPILLRWYFAAGWLSGILWIASVFAAVLLWLAIFAATQ
jgi:hypothetical protein